MSGLSRCWSIDSLGYYFRRFHTSSVWVNPCAGVDDVGFLYVSTSSVIAVTNRFWSVFSQFGNDPFDAEIDRFAGLIDHVGAEMRNRALCNGLVLISRPGVSVV
jgi:hypothetical protein